MSFSLIIRKICVSKNKLKGHTELRAKSHNFPTSMSHISQIGTRIAVSCRQRRPRFGARINRASGFYAH